LKILVVSERLSPRFDDGIKNIALNLLLQYRKNHDVRGMSERFDIPELNVVKVETNRWYTSRSVRRTVGDFAPERIIYVPWTSATLRSLFRLRMLKAWSCGARTAIVATLPMPYSTIERLAVRPLQPDLVMALAPETAELTAGLGLRTRAMRVGVDPAKFNPRTEEQYRGLRERHGVPADGFLVSHVGHLKRERLDFGLLCGVAQLPDTSMLVVGSPHTPEEREYTELLESRGVTVHRGYLEDVSQIYRMSDLYLFPVRDPFACVGIPLSIIEALACDCPVVSTPFQGLPELLAGGDGVHYGSDPRQLLELIDQARRGELELGAPADRVADFTWDSIAADLLERL